MLLKELLDKLEQQLLSGTDDPQYIRDCAVVLINLYPRDLLPDWIAIIADGDPEKLTTVLEVAAADIRADEVGNDRANL